MISFLVCAYREEKIIKECIDHILKLDGKKEILVGCDKRTAKMIRGYPIKIILEKRRLGKTKMLLKLIKEAKGNILVLNDAEHYLFPDNAIEKIEKYFQDKAIGGITLNTLMQEREITRGYWVVVESIMWEIIRFYNLINKNDRMEFINIFRKDVINLETTNDDAEIAQELIKNNYKIKTVPDVMFYGGTTNASSISDSIKQKIRTQYGWLQLRKKYKMKILPYYFKLFFFYLKIIFGTFIYILIIIYSMLRAMTIRNKSTSQIWKKIKRDEAK